MYAILNNITVEYLSSFQHNNPEKWTWSYWTALDEWCTYYQVNNDLPYLCPTEEEARKTTQEIAQYFYNMHPPRIVKLEIIKVEIERCFRTQTKNTIRKNLTSIF